MENNTQPDVLKWVKWYCYITIAAGLYGIAWAHGPYLIGKSWSTDERSSSLLAYVLTFHLYEVPPVLFNLYVAWYGLKRFAANTISSFRALLMFSVAFNFGFFTFEAITLMKVIDRVGVTWETWAIASIAVILAAGSFFAVFVHQKLLTSKPS